MVRYQIDEAAAVLDVQPETVSLWIATGQLTAAPDERGRPVLDGARLAAFAARLGEQSDEVCFRQGAGDRLHGIVTDIATETGAVRLTIQAGPFRIVSRLGRSCADQLDLRVGQATVINKRAVHLRTPGGLSRAARNTGVNLRSVLAAARR